MISSMSQTAPIYRDLSAKLSAMIRAGSFVAGDKLPSVRKSSREHQVSITTVLEAYRLLEDEGLIESRPRSGYYIKPPSLPVQWERVTANYRPKPTRIESSSIFEAVMDSVENRDMIPFAAAAPDDTILSSARLAPITAAVFRSYGAEALRYTPPMGRRELRVALSRRLLGAGIKAMPSDIITTHGATEALLLALRAVTRPGDLVAVETPTYFGILNLIRDLGLRAIEIPVSPATGLSIDALEKAVKKHRVTACVVQPNFQNPVGCVMPAEQKKRLASLSITAGFTLIEDDVYGDLSHDGSRPPSIALYGGDVIHCGSASKTIAPGLRVGWVVPGRHLQEIKRLKTIQCPWNATLSELVVAEFLDGGNYDRHLRRIRKIYAAQCARMRQEVRRHFPKSTKIHSPVGGFVLWLEMPEGFDSEAYTVDAISRGISIVPGTIFSPSLGLKNCLRISCGIAFEKRTLDAIATLGKLANRYLPS
jgi:DNA-binding transcriptional MocR family regulator